MGFEPTEPCDSLVFKTSALIHLSQLSACFYILTQAHEGVKPTTLEFDCICNYICDIIEELSRFNTRLAIAC